VKLRNLEKSLLNALSQSEGNILDNDHIISTLETLKNEAAEVTAKVAETDIVMEEISSSLVFLFPVLFFLVPLFLFSVSSLFLSCHSYFLSFPLFL
jgi:dynein heavy chain 1, cytosolic